METVLELKTQSTEQMYSQKELEQLLGVTTMTLYNWRKANPPLPFKSVATQGGARRNFYPVFQVLGWVEAYAPRVYEKIGGPNVYNSIREAGVAPSNIEELAS